MIGEKFGRLTVVEEAPRYIAPKTGKPSRRWRCKCDCGGETVTAAKKLRNGHTTSCGCAWRDSITKHGHQVGKKTPTYLSWDGMMQRCKNPNHGKFYLYGGRGIRVCKRWAKFENFLADMGRRPDGMTLDRINGMGDYEPNNCRWATPKQQQRNMRRNHIVEFRGRFMSIAEAADLAGVSNNALYPLINNHRMSIDEAIRHVGGSP